jgi:ABC-type Fe3+-siderophore transport system permease subunit
MQNMLVLHMKLKKINDKVAKHTVYLVKTTSKYTWEIHFIVLIIFIFLFIELLILWPQISVPYILLTCKGKT